MATKRQPRPARTLIIFGLTIAVLFGLAALGGTAKPRLGLDLEGGTRITLSAIGNDITSTKLAQAAGIVDSRVNGSGVSEAEVSTQGNRNIIVEIPGDNRSDLVDAVTRTAQLRFRIVAGAPVPGRAADAPSSSPSPSGSASPSGTASPSAGSSTSPSSRPSATAGQGSSASPNPRPAPFAPAPQAEPSDSPSASPSARPSRSASPSAQPSAQPSDQPSEQPQVTEQGASVDKPLEWATNPGVRWLTRFSEYTCPPAGEDVKPTADDPDEPLVACDEDGNKYLLSKAVVEGTQLRSADYGIPPQGSGYAVQLSFKGQGRSTFGEVTQALAGTGRTFAIVLDGTVLSAPTVNEPILDGNAQITGDFKEAEASSLANSLKYGALPIRFAQPPTVETIGPSLAGNQLSAGVLAGVIGLLIVMLYCLLYYRGLGIVVVASLLVAGVITYGAVLVLSASAGFTLTLPGIAGLIVGVGITADSFIVYFERIRDEMRDGKSMRVAVETGWASAKRTCLAADAVSILAAVVLYIFAIGVVRGFAFALGISTLIDIAVFFFFTKPMMTLLAKRRFFNSGSRFSGLSKETLGVDDVPARTGLAGGRA